jgi:hypothetical protein
MGFDPNARTGTRDSNDLAHDGTFRIVGRINDLSRGPFRVVG